SRETAACRAAVTCARTPADRVGSCFLDPQRSVRGLPRRVPRPAWPPRGTGCAATGQPCRSSPGIELSQPVVDEDREREKTSASRLVVEHETGHRIISVQATTRLIEGVTDPSTNALA